MRPHTGTRRIYFDGRKRASEASSGGSVSSFTPITNTYITGTNAIEIAPVGATQCVVTSFGGGAGGARSAAGLGGGGGGAARCATGPFAVTGGDQLIYTIGVHGNGRTGSVGSGTDATATTTNVFTTPTVLTSQSSTVGAQTINSPSFSAAVGTLIVVSGTIIKTTGSALTVTISDSATNTWTTYTDYQSGSATKGFISWAYVTNVITSGTVTVALSGGANWTAVAFGVTGVTSGAISTSTEDTGFKATTNATAITTPTITSGTPANTYDIAFCTYANAGSTADTYTEDTGHGWINVFSKSGSTSCTFSQAYQINTGSGTLIHAPTTTSRAYVQCVIALKNFCGGFNGIQHSAGGGTGGTTTTGGGAGVASGGTTNTNGNAGTTGTSGKGGDAASPGGGTGGPNDTGTVGGGVGTAPGGGGGGGDELDAANGKNGADGQISFAYT